MGDTGEAGLRLPNSPSTRKREMNLFVLKKMA